MDEVEGAEAWIELGVIARPHGVLGELRVHVFNPKSTLLEELEEVFLLGDEGSPRLVSIESTRRGPKALLVRLAGIASRGQADELRGCRLGVPRSALPALDEGEYYYADLVGLAAYEGDRRVGEVVGVLDYPSVECLQVRTEEGLLEVPMLPRWVAEVDVRAGEVRLVDLSDIPVQKDP